MADARAELMDLLALPQVDREAIRKKQDDLVAGQRRLQDLVVEHLLAEKELLTSEQRHTLFALGVETGGAEADTADLFGANVRRTPLFFVDVDIHNLVLESERDLPSESGWGKVPTPMF